MKRISLIPAQVIIVLLFLFLVGCSGDDSVGQPIGTPVNEANGVLTLPPLTASQLNDRPLRVVATTSIIGDVVGQIGGDLIDLDILIGPGRDPHSFSPSVSDMTTVSAADVIIVNGWNLEEGLLNDLQTIGTRALFVPISAGIEPLPAGEHGHDEPEHDNDKTVADPHVWFALANVRQWVNNTRDVFSALDPAHAADYEVNAGRYLAQLDELGDTIAAEIARIPADRRRLVTNHDNLAYFAAENDFVILGTVIPSISTMAEPSASDLTGLIETMNAAQICVLFTEDTVNQGLTRTLAGDLKNCPTVEVVELPSGALGEVGTSTDSYLGLMRTMVDKIVAALAS